MLYCALIFDYMAATPEKDGVRFLIGIVTGAVAGYVAARLLSRESVSRRRPLHKRPQRPLADDSKGPSGGDKRLGEAHTDLENTVFGSEITISPTDQFTPLPFSTGTPNPEQFDDNIQERNSGLENQSR